MALEEREVATSNRRVLLPARMDSSFAIPSGWLECCLFARIYSFAHLSGDIDLDNISGREIDEDDDEGSVL